MNINALSIAFSTKFLPLIFTIVGFGLLITVHEFGHFIFCKIFGIHTPTFSIGMGPKLFQKKIGDTNFCISAIPLGGYVEISGLAEVGQGEQKHAKIKDNSSFSSKPYWQKILVLLGGILFNLLFAYITLSTIFFIGMPKQRAELKISSNISNIIKEKYDFRADDKIISINNKTLSEEPKKFQAEIQDNLVKSLAKKNGTTINFQVLRDSLKININFTTESKKLNELLIDSLEPKTTPIPGQYERYPLFQAIGHGIKVTNQWISQMIYGIKYLITQKTLKGVGGPIMILSKTFQTAQKGLLHLFIFLAIISINLAIINLLPLGALDGGQLLFATIEAIIRREIPEIIRLIINIGSWILLLGLLLYLSFKEILALFLNTQH